MRDTDFPYAVSMDTHNYANALSLTLDTWCVRVAWCPLSQAPANLSSTVAARPINAQCTCVT